MGPKEVSHKCDIEVTGEGWEIQKPDMKQSCMYGYLSCLFTLLSIGIKLHTLAKTSPNPAFMTTFHVLISQKIESSQLVII